MYRNAHGNPSQPKLNSTRQGQLNKSGCGCRCGRGGGVQNGGGENKDDDSASTLVGSGTSDVGVQNVIPVETNGRIEMYQTRIEMYINEAENPVHVMDPLPGLPIEFVPDDPADSMRNEANSDSHSVITMPDNLPSRGMSPRLALTGAGSWADDILSTCHCPHKTFFLVSPLRLTPQLRYCRGLVASHLVLRDETALRDAEELRVYDHTFFAAE